MFTSRIINLRNVVERTIIFMNKSAGEAKCYGKYIYSSNILFWLIINDRLSSFVLAWGFSTSIRCHVNNFFMRKNLIFIIVAAFFIANQVETIR